MADLAGAPPFGNVVTELLNTISEAKVHNLGLKACLKQLKDALELLTPLMEGAKQLHVVLMDSKKEEINVLYYLLRQGEELVLKCSKLNCYNFLKRRKYTAELIQLSDTLLIFYKTNTQIDTWLDTQKLLQLVKGSEKLNVLRGKKNEDVGADHSSYTEPKIPKKIFGLEGPLEELEKKLFCEDISVIEVCGPAGCGKTTLVAKLCRDKKITDTFKENIFFLTVSNSPDVLGLLQRLWLCLLKARDVPKFSREEDAKQQLSDRLHKIMLPPMLIVLDDVWSASVIEKLVFRVPNLKTIITSRTRFELFDFTYSVRTLKESDAMDLFCHSACIEDTALRNSYKELVQQIVKGCKGFPLALKVIGHSLRHKTLVVWQAMAEMLKQGSQVFDACEYILNCLSSTLTFLDNQLRECFADLGCFPEDKMIPAASLIDIWSELYGLSEDEAYATLLTFSTRYLVTLVERTRNDAVEDGIFNDLFVVQHDLLRDLAIGSSQNSHINQNVRLIMNQKEDSLPDSWKQSKDEPFMARIVSLHTGEMSSSSWFEMELLHAEVVIINFLSKTYHLPPFIEKMANLKVLIIANHGLVPAELFIPPKLGHSICLKRTRLERISISSLCAIKQPFRSLKKICMFFCEFGEVDSYPMLVFPTIFPELTEFEIDYCNLVRLPPGICEIEKLRKLKVSKCPDLIELPEKLGKLSNLEVLSLHACSALEDLPNSLCKLKRLRLLDVSDCSNISGFPEEFGELSDLRKINMRSCSQVTELPQSVRQLKGLKEVICDEDTASLWEPLKHVLTMMELHTVKEDLNLNFLI